MPRHSRRPCPYQRSIDVTRFGDITPPDHSSDRGKKSYRTWRPSPCVAGLREGNGVWDRLRSLREARHRRSFVVADGAVPPRALDREFAKLRSPPGRGSGERPSLPIPGCQCELEAERVRALNYLCTVR